MALRSKLMRFICHSISYYLTTAYRRIFLTNVKPPISEGVLFNFNLQAFKELADFEQLSIAHADETGININGKRHWLHCASNASRTHFYPHQKRGTEAVNDIGILPRYQGVLCHDHWTGFCFCKTCISTIHGGQTLLSL
jgi:transposase